MISRSRLHAWRSLQRREGRREQRSFLAEGGRVLEEAARHGRWPQAIGWCDARLSERERDWLEQLPAGVERVQLRREDLERIADAKTPSGMLGVFPLPENDLDALGPAARSLILDGVSDPGNVGTLMRSALAFGAERVLLTEDSADPWQPKVVRSTAGALFGLQVARVPRADLLDHLHRTGIPLAVATVDGTPDLREVAARPCVALAVGAEARGVGEDLLARARWKVSVRQTAGVESLNAAVAGSILLHALFTASP